MTIRESIEDLVDEGLLYRRHGVGTFVAYPHLQRDHTRLTSFFDKAENDGIQVRATLLLKEVVPARTQNSRSAGYPRRQPSDPCEDPALCRQCAHHCP